MNHEKYHKIFGIGGPKTGTTSLKRSLQLLGFQHFGWSETLHEHYLAGNYEPIFQVADRYDSFEDGPWNMDDFYKVLDRKYPDSKFILTVRDEVDWLKSHESHFSSEGARPVSGQFWIYDYNPEQQLAAWQKRNKEIIEYFANRPHQLLILDICANEGWPELCGFLGKEIPSLPFPHANKSKLGRKGQVIRHLKRHVPQILKKPLRKLL